MSARRVRLPRRRPGGIPTPDLFEGHLAPGEAAALLLVAAGLVIGWGHWLTADADRSGVAVAVGWWLLGLAATWVAGRVGRMVAGLVDHPVPYAAVVFGGWSWAVAGPAAATWAVAR